MKSYMLTLYLDMALREVVTTDRPLLTGMKQVFDREIMMSIILKHV